MRAVLSLVVSAVLSLSLLFTFVPPRAVAAPPIEKASCCAKKNTAAVADNCMRHAPKSDQEKQCCEGCGFCLAALVVPVTTFVYSPTGDEAFRDFVLCERVRSHRPPVPPPRGTVVS